MDKPKQHERTPILCYFECKDYIDKVLGRDIDDYYGYHKNRQEVYCNFWHWLGDNHEIVNGGTFYMFFGTRYLDNMEPWAKEIHEAFKKEFAECIKDDYLEFEVDW